MKKTLILAGAGGCMRELLWQIEELNKQEETWEVLGFVDISNELECVKVGEKTYPYLGTDTYLLDRKEETNVAVCVANPALRKKIVEKLQQNPHLIFPNLVMSRTCVCSDIRMGKGNIISMDCRISTNVAIGDFVFMNMGAVISHDGTLGDYITLNPDVRLAGNVSVEDDSELGMGTRVIQGIKIGKKTIVGAGSVVIRDLPGHCKAVGVPAKKR